MSVWEVVGAVVLDLIGIALFIFFFTFISIFGIISTLPENYEEMTDEEKDAYWEEFNKKLLESSNTTYL